MNIWLSGSRSFGSAVYRAIRDAHGPVCGVFAPPGDPLHACADAYGTPSFMPGALRSSQIPDGADLLVCAHSHYYVSAPARLRFRLGAVGYHPSLLPLHRGRDAVAWTLRMGDRIAGGSVYWLNDTVDGGPLAAQGFCHVVPGETPSELWRRALFPMGIRLLLATLADVKAGKIVRVPQDPALATWEPSLSGAPRLFRPELLQIGAGPEFVTTPGSEKVSRGA